jgi:deoxyribonuclease-4
MHPGAHLGRGTQSGLTTLTANLDRAIEQATAETVIILLETTAGQGTTLGSQFTELAHVLEHSRHNARLGICLDTCHVFAAGYDIRARQGYEKTVTECKRHIGLDRLKFFHINDSKKECGSRVDRHTHIGRGYIGLDGFKRLVNDPRFIDHPMVLETPKGRDLLEDRRNLAVLRKLVSSK